MSPNAIKVVTKTDVERIEKELWGGRDITQISYPEFIEKQKLMLKRIPIIAVTGNALHIDKEEAMNIGFAGYLLKPFSIEVFLETISDFFKNQRMEN